MVNSKRGEKRLYAISARNDTNPAVPRFVFKKLDAENRLFARNRVLQYGNLSACMHEDWGSALLKKVDSTSGSSDSRYSDNSAYPQTYQPPFHRHVMLTYLPGFCSSAILLVNKFQKFLFFFSAQPCSCSTSLS